MNTQRGQWPRFPIATCGLFDYGGGMCGRYVLDKDIDIIEKRFNVGTRGQHAFEARYNIAPSQTLPVITSPGTLTMLPWGFAPVWATKGVINARIESLEEKPYFKNSQHCLIPATGFYEWKQTSEGKVPYFIHLPNNNLFAFAGVCNRAGYAIVTTQAEGPVADIHTRMPVILTTQQEKLWLDGSFPETVTHKLLTVMVSTAVNTPTNDTSDLLTSVNK